jgi:KRAB domain-containing zinc finger protein
MLQTLNFEPSSQNANVEIKKPVVEIENSVVDDVGVKDKVEDLELMKPVNPVGKSSMIAAVPSKLDTVRSVAPEVLETVPEREQNEMLGPKETVKKKDLKCPQGPKETVEKKDLKCPQGPKETVEKKDLKCPHCPKVCQMEFTYERHLLVHSGTKDYLCTICHRAFPLKCNLAMHMKAKHTATSEIVVQTAKKLTGKALKIQKKLKFTCEHCQEAFRFKKDLRKHVFEVHKSKSGRKKPVETVTYTCPMCEKKFYLQTKLVCHMETEHLISMDLNTSSVESPVTIPPKCIPAPVPILGTNTLPRKSPSVRKLFQCTTCQKCFRKRKKLNQHKKVHVIQKSLESPQTSVKDSSEISFTGTFTSQETLTTQENMDNSFTSQGTSDISFNSQEIADSSASIPSQKKPRLNISLFHCNECNKMFGNRKQLSRHKRKHNFSKRWNKAPLLLSPKSEPNLEEYRSQEQHKLTNLKNWTSDSCMPAQNTEGISGSLGKLVEEVKDTLPDIKTIPEPIEMDPGDVKIVPDLAKTVCTVARNVSDETVLSEVEQIVENQAPADSMTSVLDVDTSVSVDKKVKKLSGEKKKKVKRTKKKKVIDLSLFVLECHVCTKRFKQKCNLINHLKQMHDLDVDVIPQDILDKMNIEYKCETCARTFSQKCSLKLHMNMLHSGAVLTTKPKVVKKKVKRLMKPKNKDSHGLKKRKSKHNSSGSKELLSLLDGPNLEQAALEEKCRSMDGIELKRPRKMLRIPNMNDELYTCHFCGKDYVTFSRYQTHVDNCGVQNVSRKMKKKYEEFSPKAKLIPSMEKGANYSLDYDTEPYTDEDSSLDTSVETSYITFSPDSATRKQEFDQFEQIETCVQKLSPNTSPSTSSRKHSSIGSRRRTPNVSPAGSRRTPNASPSCSHRQTPIDSPVRVKGETSNVPHTGRSPLRKSRKSFLCIPPECSSSPKWNEAAVTPCLKECQVMVTDCKTSPEDTAKDLLSNPSKDLMAHTNLGTDQSKVAPKYTPTYSDISEDEDDIPLNRLAKVVCAKQALGTSKETVKMDAPKVAPPLRISPRRRSWDVGQQIQVVPIRPSRQVSRVLTFSSQEQVSLAPKSVFDFEPQYKSYSQSLLSSQRQRHCSDDGKIQRTSRWDQPPKHLVSKNPELSIYDFQDDDIDTRISPVKMSKLKSFVSSDKTLSSGHLKSKGSSSGSPSIHSKKWTSPSGKSSKIHQKKSRWSSPKPAKHSPVLVPSDTYGAHDDNASDVPKFALSNFSPKRKSIDSLALAGTQKREPFQGNKALSCCDVGVNRLDEPIKNYFVEPSKNIRGITELGSSVPVMTSVSSQNIQQDSVSSANASRLLNSSQNVHADSYSAAFDLEKPEGASSANPAGTSSSSAVKKEASSSGNRFICYHCGESFKFHSLYSRHLKKEHSVGKLEMDWSI